MIFLNGFEVVYKRKRVTKDGSENVDLNKWLNIGTFAEIEGI